MEEQCEPLNGLTYGQVPHFLTLLSLCFHCNPFSHDVLWDVFVLSVVGHLRPEPDTSAAEGRAPGQNNPTIHY